VIAAVVWVGGNLILAMVIVPYFRQTLPPVKRIQLLTQIGKRFEPIVWGCVLVLFFTGIGNTFNAIDFSSPIVTSFMRTLLIKLILFIALLILTFLHSFVYAPKLLMAIETLDETLEELPSEVKPLRTQMSIETLDETLEELPPEVKPLRTQMSIVSSLMGVISLLILLAAVALRMGI
jgi:uncharacterized membrane protein